MMNPSELAQKMLKWEELTTAANVIAAEIEAAVLEIGKTQTVGNVRASFANGRKSYDYKTPVLHTATDEAIDRHSKIVVDWRAICNEMGAEPIVTGQGEPSVKVKLL